MAGSATHEQDFLVLTDLWDDDVECVAEGDVFTRSGKPVSMKQLVQRRWGWPKQAAVLVDGYLFRRAKVEGKQVLWLTRKKRVAQAMELMREMPELLPILLNGLAQDVQREAQDADRKVVSITVSLDHAVDDDGLSRGVMRALAARLGCSVDELREATFFTGDGEARVMRVDASKFEP